MYYLIYYLIFRSIPSANCHVLGVVLLLLRVHIDATTENVRQCIVLNSAPLMTLLNYDVICYCCKYQGKIIHYYISINVIDAVTRFSKHLLGVHANTYFYIIYFRKYIYIIIFYFFKCCIL